MRQQQFRQSTCNETEFRVIRGFLADHSPQPVMVDLVNTAWTFAQSALWNCQQFSSKECEDAKAHVSHFLQLFRNQRKGFLVFCQRILLARQFLEIGSGPQLYTLPSTFLDRKHELGFAFTKALFKEVRVIRGRLPGFERELRALAEAVLEFSEAPCRKNFRYWKYYFIDRDKPELLNLFQLFVTNFLYSK